MKITAFKKRFLELTVSEQQTTVREMKKSDVKKDHMKGINPSMADEMVEAFSGLVQWCEEIINKPKK